MKTTRLTGLLHELEDLLDEIGAPFSSYALPGIDDEQIDELLAPSGLVAPTEMREWWRWHNGTRVDTPLNDRHSVGPASWGPMGVQKALWDRETWLEDIPDDGDGGWNPDWISVAWALAGHGRLVGRLDESTSDEVRVGCFYIDDWDNPVAPSMASMVEDVLRVLREGQVFWNPADGGYWDEGPRWRDYPLYLR